MKNKASIFFLSLCMICGSACNNQTSNHNGSIPIVDLEKEYPEKDLLVSENAEIEYIRMETSDEILLDGIAGLHLSVTNQYITTCNSREGRIFVFNREGKHLHNFNKKGNSGEEYVYPIVVRIDDNTKEIFVLDIRNKVMVYTLDGKFKRVLNLPEEMTTNELWNYNDEWLLAYDSYNLDQNKPCTEQPFFFLSKKDGNVKRIGLTASDRTGNRVYSEQNGEKFVFQISFTNIYKNGDEFVLSELGGDTIYTLKQGEVSPLLIRTPGSKAKEARSMMCTVLKVGDYITVTETPKNFEATIGSTKIETKDISYNLKTKEGCILSLKDDINFTEPTEIRHNSGWVESSENHILWMPDTDKLFQWKEEGKLKGKLAEMVENMTEDDNPILIIYKFR